MEDLIAVASIFVLFSSLFQPKRLLSSLCFSRSVRSFSTVYQFPNSLLARVWDEEGREKQSRESGKLSIQAGVWRNFEFLTGIHARWKVQRYGATKVRFVAGNIPIPRMFRVSSSLRKSFNIAQFSTCLINRNLYLKYLEYHEEFVANYLIN